MGALTSIIIPIYNLEDYVEKCIESALKQSYKNIEIILVDDGSTDKSGSICDYYGNIDNRVRVVHKENGGLVSARKAGLEISCGEYIVPLDADDWIEPAMVESMVSIMERGHIDFAQCSIVWEYINGKNEDSNDVLKEGEYDLSKYDNELYENLFIKRRDVSLNGARLNICSCIFSRELMLRSQNLINNTLVNGEDDACFFIAMLQTSKFYKFRHAYYHSLVRGNSMSHAQKMFDVNQVFIIESLVRPVLNRHPFFELLEPMFNRYLLNLFNIYAIHYWKIGYDKLYLFDSDILPSGAKIVIYGAGVVGQSYYLLLSKSYNIVGWIDEKKQHVNDINIDKVEAIKKFSYDYVILAIKDEKIAKEMRQRLIGLGVNTKQIIWNIPRVSSWAFYVSDRT